MTSHPSVVVLTTANDTTVPADDLLSGASAIAGFLGWSRRRLYYEADGGRIKATRFPVFRIGITLCARKSTLLRWLADREAAALQGARP